MVIIMKLIDADKMAVDEFEAYIDSQSRVDDFTRSVNSMVHSKIQQLIANTPTLDAVPVVRCRDCKFNDCGDCIHPENTAHHSGEEGYSIPCLISVSAAHFCSYGERNHP